MKSNRFYIVITLALLVYVSANQVFTGYDLIRTKGNCKEALHDTKYFHSDCGRVIFLDRTEDQQNRDINYFLTYYSPVRGENHTVKVTPGAYASGKRSKKNNNNICFTVADAHYFRDSMGYEFFWGLMFVATVVFGFQLYYWRKEEFS